MGEPSGGGWRWAAVAAAVALAVSVVAAIVVATLPRDEREPGPTVEGPATRGVAGPLPGREAPVRPVERTVGLQHEDLAVFAPDEAGVAELDEAQRRRQGEVRSPGTDPEAGRAATSRPGWAEAEAAALRQGLTTSVVGAGTRIDRVECDRGRCLVELSYDAMASGLDRIEPIRHWLMREVSCPAYTEGPDEGESPAVRPSQQIWILCGEPEPAP